MREIEIPLPRSADYLLVSKTIEEICISSGLRVMLKASLGKFPSSTHWHIKSGADKGTLEITLWPAQHRAWFSIQDGRAGTWIEKKVAMLQDLFQRSFQESHTPNTALESTPTAP
jgi:hypothetical protein